MAERPLPGCGAAGPAGPGAPAEAFAAAAAFAALRKRVPSESCRPSCLSEEESVLLMLLARCACGEEPPLGLPAAGVPPDEVRCGEPNEGRRPALESGRALLPGSGLLLRGEAYPASSLGRLPPL